eukprot:999960-Pleurochrysis_carterae.AAC.1
MDNLTTILGLLLTNAIHYRSNCANRKRQFKCNSQLRSFPAKVLGSTNLQRRKCSYSSRPVVPRTQRSNVPPNIGSVVAVPCVLALHLLPRHPTSLHTISPPAPGCKMKA